MSKKSASPAASQHSATTINTDVSIMKLVDIKGETHNQFKTIEKVNTSPHLYLNLATSPHMYLNVDASSLASTQHNAPSVRSVLISKHKSSDFAPPTDNAQPPEPAATTTTDKKTLKIWPAVKSLNEIQRSESVSLTSERNQKNKHHHHHRRHYQHNRKRRHSCHHHHRHSYHPQSNSVEEQRKQTNRPSSKVIIANSKPSTPQKPVLVYRRVLNNKGYTVNADTVANVSQEANRESIVSNNQQEPLIIYRDSNISQNVKTNKNVSPVIVDQNRTSKKQKGNIPLKSVENKIVSQRTTSQSEIQVESYPHMIYTKSPSTICTDSCSIVNNSCGIQQIEQVYYDDSCCTPSTITDCTSDPYILQQYDSSVCMPQQQQQQILLCSDPTTTQDFVCSSSNCNFVQQIPCQQQQQQQQQQYICIDNTSPTIINQLPVCNSISTSTQPQSYLCVPQTSSPQSASIVIQQPSQMSAQPIQFIQNPQQQTGQYLQISSASPQVIQAIPSPGLGSIQPQIIQTVQAPAQTIKASPQILYQRPYDPIVVPVQNQQFSLATTPAIGLSQPCYIPQSRVNNGPRLFQHALARAVSDRTGMPSCLPPSTDMQIAQRPFSHAFDGGRLASTANSLSTDKLPSSMSVPIIPMGTNGLLIPFKPSPSSPNISNGISSQSSSYPSSSRNIDRIRQQIQRRAQFLADYKRNNPTQLSSARTNSANPIVPSQPNFSSHIQQPFAVPLSSTERRPSTSIIPNSSPLSSTSRLPVPPPLPSSQTPYIRGNIFGTSSSSSSRSSASSTSPMPRTRSSASGLGYAQASFTNSRSGSTSSGPFTLYQSLRP